MPEEHVRWRLVGLAGSILLTIGGVVVGALPRTDPFAGAPVIAAFREAPGAAMACAYAGLVLLVVAWLRLGQQVGGGALEGSELTATLAWSAGRAGRGGLAGHAGAVRPDLVVEADTAGIGYPVRLCWWRSRTAVPGK
jgi:hypothetical protein